MPAVDASPTTSGLSKITLTVITVSTAMSCRPMNELRAARYLKAALVGLEMREAQ
jgi:hypothetical protein